MKLIEYNVTHKPNYFFALLPPLHVCHEINEWAQRWREELNGDHVAEWLLPEDYKVVIRCLGELSETQMPGVLQAGSAAAARMGGLRLGFTETGEWPNSHRPSSLCIRADSQIFSTVHGLVREELAAAGAVQASMSATRGLWRSPIAARVSATHSKPGGQKSPMTSATLHSPSYCCCKAY